MDPQSGYCSRNMIYYSKMTPAPTPPPSEAIDLVTYLFAPKRGNAVALVDGRTGRTITYAALEERVRVVAAGLWQRLHIRKSDVVCILSPNSLEFGILFLAIASLGGIMTTLNPLNTNADIKKQTNLAGKRIPPNSPFRDACKRDRGILPYTLVISQVPSTYSRCRSCCLRQRLRVYLSL